MCISITYVILQVFYFITTVTRKCCCTALVMVWLTKSVLPFKILHWVIIEISEFLLKCYFRPIVRVHHHITKVTPEKYEDNPVNHSKYATGMQLCSRRLGHSWYKTWSSVCTFRSWWVLLRKWQAHEVVIDTTAEVVFFFCRSTLQLIFNGVLYLILHVVNSCWYNLGC